jgi:hypothetical protein
LSDKEFGCWDSTEEKYCDVDQRLLVGLPTNRIALRFNTGMDMLDEIFYAPPLQRAPNYHPHMAELIAAAHPKVVKAPNQARSQLPAPRVITAWLPRLDRKARTEKRVEEVAEQQGETAANSLLKEGGTVHE